MFTFTILAGKEYILIVLLFVLWCIAHKKYKLIVNSEYLQIFNNQGQCSHMIHNGNEETANWMRFVQQTKSSNQQNLVAYQQGGDIYFITSKDVEPYTELLYWYSRDTATFMGILAYSHTWRPLPETGPCPRNWCSQLGAVPVFGPM